MHLNPRSFGEVMPGSVRLVRLRRRALCTFGRLHRPGSKILSDCHMCVHEFTFAVVCQHVLLRFKVCPWISGVNMCDPCAAHRCIENLAFEYGPTAHTRRRKQLGVTCVAYRLCLGLHVVGELVWNKATTDGKKERHTCTQKVA